MKTLWWNSGDSPDLFQPALLETDWQREENERAWFICFLSNETYIPQTNNLLLIRLTINAFFMIQDQDIWYAFILQEKLLDYAF